jgi:hypothetical protein
LLQDFSIPKDRAAIFSIQALMEEGLSLNARAINDVRAMVLRHANPRRAALLAARALAAGLQVNDEGLDALIRLLSGSRTEDTVKEPERVFSRQPDKDAGRDAGKDAGKDNKNGAGDESGRDSQGNNGGGPGNGSGKDSGKDPKDSRKDPKDSGKDPKVPGRNPGRLAVLAEPAVLAGQQNLDSSRIHTSQAVVRCECQDDVAMRKALESAFMDLSSRAAADPGFAALARKGPDGRGWLCVPYRFSIDGVDFSGYFRIIFNYAACKVERLVVEIDSSGLTRVCDVSWGPSGKPRLRYMPGSPPEGDEFDRLFGPSMKVEIYPPGEAPGLVDTLHREIDGHV